MLESAGAPTWPPDWDSGSGDWRPAFDVGFDDMLFFVPGCILFLGRGGGNFCVVYYRIGCYYESKGGDLEGRAGRKNGRKERK